MIQNNLPPQTAVMANSLYHSLQGQYFVGFADDLHFEKDRIAWAALYNPRGSGKNLFVNVWTVTVPENPSVYAQIWLNARLPGYPEESLHVTPSNTALCPLPRPRVRLLQASEVCEMPYGGAEAYLRIAPPNGTVVSEEDGKFILPPGGNFAVVLAGSNEYERSSNIRVAFGWWEQPVYDC